MEKEITKNSVPYNPDQVSDITGRVSGLLNEIQSLKQGRSNFALDHFVVCSHDTPAMQRIQILDELEGLTFAIQDMRDELELALLTAEEEKQKATAKPRRFVFGRNRDTDRKRAEINWHKAERNAVQLKLAITARTREVVHLLELLDQMPPVTREQIEAEQPQYWASRLTRQAYFEQRGGQGGTGFGRGNLEAMLQTIAEPGKPLPMAIDQLAILTAGMGSAVKFDNELPAGEPTPQITKGGAA